MQWQQFLKWFILLLKLNFIQCLKKWQFFYHSSYKLYRKNLDLGNTKFILFQSFNFEKLKYINIHQKKLINHALSVKHDNQTKIFVFNWCKFMNKIYIIYNIYAALVHHENICHILNIETSISMELLITSSISSLLIFSPLSPSWFSTSPLPLVFYIYFNKDITVRTVYSNTCIDISKVPLKS